MSEHTAQAAFITEILYIYRNDDSFIRPLFFSVPNGAVLGGNRFALAAKLKSEGMVSGVADILYLQPRGDHSFFALEMKKEERKREKNGGLSGEQEHWLRSAQRVGAYIAVCYNTDESVKEFTHYMGLEPK